MTETEKRFIQHTIIDLLEQQPILTGEQIIKRFPDHERRQIEDVLLTMLFSRNISISGVGNGDHKRI